MAPHRKPPLWPAVLIGILAARMAAADDFAQPSSDELVVRWGVSALVIGILVRVLRHFLARWLAPKPATPRSKSLTLLASLALGVVLALIGTAPAVAAGLAGKLVGGLAAGGFAFFVAKLAGPKVRGEKP